jgi:hypothetical protein
MQQLIAPHLRTLLATRDTVAAQAAEAEAHELVEAAELWTRQSELEDLLEQQLPINEWRRLFTEWVVQDVRRSHDAAHPAPEQCRICAAATRPIPIRQSA